MMDKVYRARRYVCALALFALVPSGMAFAVSTHRETSIQTGLLPRGAEIVTIDARSLAKQDGPLSVEIASPSMRFDLRLEPHDLRAPDSREVITSPDGTTTDVARVPIETYAGTALDHPDSVARFTLRDATLVGSVVAEGETYFVEPLSTYSLAGGPSDYVLYALSDVEPEIVGGCAAERVLEAAELVGLKTGAGSVSKGEARVIEIATDADDAYVRTLGSASAANAEILSILNQVEGLYQSELSLTFSVVMQNSYRGGDPYGSITGAQQLLDALRTEWTTTAKASVARDVTHLWTNRVLGGSTVGIAYTNVVCSSPGYCYGLSKRLTSSPAKSILTAHEIGHNLGACHSDTSCNTNPSSCSNTVMQSAVGTGFTFCPFSRDQIRTYVDANAGCLGTKTLGPSAPQDLRARATSASQVTLTWLDTSRAETGFVVERRKVERGTSWERVATMGADATSFANNGLLAGTKYRYRVRAINAEGASDWSNRAAATTPNR
jgi:hypothetical protein